jgi:hypothetical protein
MTWKDYLLLLLYGLLFGLGFGGAVAGCIGVRVS